MNTLALMCLGLVPLHPVVTLKPSVAGDINQVDRTRIAHQRREAICAFIAESEEPVTKHDVAEAFGVPWTTAHADLYKLRDKGRIVPITDESHRLLGFGVKK